MVKNAGQINLSKYSRESRNWLLKQYTSVQRGSVREKTFLSQNDRRRNKIMPGRMYMFSYDPKLKATLPYYDAFPLVFPIGPAKDGFLGLNLHYLPPILRARFFDALSELEVNGELQNERTKILMTYNLLASAARYRYFKPCIKHYLYSQLKSSFIYVPPEEWNITLFLPSHNFKKASVDVVWKDSRKIINQS